MPTPEPPLRDAPLAHPDAVNSSRRWIFAALAGITLSTLLGMSGLTQHVPAGIAAVLIIACGWAATIALAPWKAMRDLVPNLNPEIDEMCERIGAILDGDRDEPLKRLVLKRDDELGRLSELVHDLAAEAHTHRQRTRLLHRRMNETIESQTNRATAHLRREAATDPLTGLLNRRGLEDWLNRRLDSSDSHCRLTVLAFDLDLFKSVNDMLGHEMGDKCLVFLANLLRSTLRSGDCAVRLGGDEFIVVMSSISSENAAKVARRLASLFAQMPWSSNKPPRPTLACGIASGEVRVAEDFAAILRSADAQLYCHKQQGRSQEMKSRRGAA